MTQRDGRPRILVGRAAAACGSHSNAERRVELHLPAIDQHPEERRRQALRRRPRPRPRRHVHARRVALVDDLVALHDEQTERDLLG